MVNRNYPKKITVFIIFFLCIVAGTYAQEDSLPMTVYGTIPSPFDNKVYRLQIGAFIEVQNASKAFSLLEKFGFRPVYEMYGTYYRVLLTGIAAFDVPTVITKLDTLGFKEVIITEDEAAYYRVPPPPLVPAPTQVPSPPPFVTQVPSPKNIPSASSESPMMQRQLQEALDTLKQILDNNPDAGITFEEYMETERKMKLSTGMKLYRRQSYIRMLGGW
jgi:hypothetical protein